MSAPRRDRTEVDEPEIHELDSKRKKKLRGYRQSGAHDMMEGFYVDFEKREPSVADPPPHLVESKLWIVFLQRVETQHHMCDLGVLVIAVLISG